jgi:SEC-C motif-containing protein
VPLSIKPSAKCPCHSGKAYRDCCKPVHEDPRAATRVEALMRSRYSAFALVLVDHLIATLHASHPDAKLDRPALAQSFASSARAHKYTGLTILDSSEDGERATVTFRARLFERGRDRSFTERSTFLKTESGWQYASAEIDDDSDR